MSEHIVSKSKTVKIPGPGHPISVECNASRVVVAVAGRIVANTREALTLREASYPPVQYIPRKDVDWRERTTPPTAPTRATALTTAFRWAVCAPPTLSGPNRVSAKQIRIWTIREWRRGAEIRRCALRKRTFAVAETAAHSRKSLKSGAFS
jgi:hypothetical protein